MQELIELIDTALLFLSLLAVLVQACGLGDLSEGEWVFRRGELKEMRA